MKTHGMRGTPTYQTWICMRQRCLNENASDYDRYGGRGITICSEWGSFENFFRDMGVRPEGHTLDRKEVNGPYCKDNCKWSTNKEQLRNTRVNRNLTFDGRTQCVTAWAEEMGIKPVTLLRRLNKGWSLEKAIVTGINATSQGVAHNETFYEHQGETRNLKDWARHIGMKYCTLHTRVVRLGWSFERAITTGVQCRV